MTIATAIRIGNPASWTLAEQARDESGGLIDAVTDKQILEAYRLVARTEAVFVEPASAASVAGLLQTAADGRLPKGSTVVCTVTGNGLKDPEWAIAGAPKPITVPVDGHAAAGAAGTGVKPAFRGGAVHVRVPATSANLGPGFDALGLALSLHDDVVARVGEDGLVIDIAGEGADLPRDETHLVVRAMRAVFDRLGGQPRGIELACANRIPQSRGLGSSGAAIVAGAVLARALVLGGERELPDDELLAIASALEGHPDNVAACLLGGLTIAWTEDATARAVRLDCDPAIRPVALVPAFSASTEQARGLLPAMVPHADAAFAAGRAALLIAALTGAPHTLLAATQDRLHQQYRSPAMPQSAELLAALRAAGLAAVVSGAGPAVLVLARDEDEVARAGALTPPGWQHLALAVAAGAHVVPPAH